MKDYPKIFGVDFHSKLKGEYTLAFKKLDGSNLRFEWTPSSRWYKFGTRTRTFDKSDKEYGPAIDLFLKKYGEALEKVFVDKYSRDGKPPESAMVFAEYFGPYSFAGQHDESWLKKFAGMPHETSNDPKQIIMFDVNIYKRGFVDPQSFVKNFSHVEIPPVVYEGKLTENFIYKVRHGELPVVEGVICKGGSGHQLWRCKIKTYEYLNRLKTVFGKLWNNYWE